MKKMFIAAAVVLLTSLTAGAQNCMVVNTETVFKSIAAWNGATAQLDKLAETRQAEIDASFDQVETMYNAYMQQKAVLTDLARQQREKAILDREAEINKRQEAIFGTDGELMKKRNELMKPIEDRVANAIKEYAQRSGADIVIDVASNPSVLWYAPAADRTQEIINLVK